MKYISAAVLTIVVFLLLLLAGCATTQPPSVVAKERLVAVKVDKSYFVTEESPIPPNEDEFNSKPMRQRLITLGEFASNLMKHAHALQLRINSIEKAMEESAKRIEESNP